MGKISNESANAAMQQVSNNAIASFYKDGERQVIKLRIKKATYGVTRLDENGVIIKDDDTTTPVAHVLRQFTIHTIETFKGRVGENELGDKKVVKLQYREVMDAMTETREFALVAGDEPMETIERWLRFGEIEVSFTWHQDVEELHSSLVSLAFDEWALEEMKEHIQDAREFAREEHKKRLKERLGLKE